VKNAAQVPERANLLNPKARAAIGAHACPKGVYAEKGFGLQHMHFGLFVAGNRSKGWWTWTGSNRRPLPFHVRNINDLQASQQKTKDLAER
jgi:hypothetical protein